MNYELHKKISHKYQTIIIYGNDSTFHLTSRLSFYAEFAGEMDYFPGFLTRHTHNN